MKLLKRYRIGASLFLLALSTLFAVVVILNTLQTPRDPFGRDAITDPPFTSLTYSIHTSLWWDYYWADVHMDWVRLMAFSHVKQVFAWEDIEPQQGEWHFTRADEILDGLERRGLKLIARLSNTPTWVQADSNLDFIDAPPSPDHMADWANYCGTLATRYKGRIAAYQIWNEPNLTREWGNNPPDAAGYTELLRVCSEAIRQADPDAILISAGLSPTGNHDETAIPDDIFLQALYDNGFQRYIDVVGMHAPGYSSPEVSPDEQVAAGGQRFFTFRRVEDLRRIMVQNGDAARQAAILEFGWTTDIEGHNPDYAWFAVDKETQARYMVEAYTYAAENWRPWVGLMSAIYIADPTWTPDDEEYWWAVAGAKNDFRPAFIELANMPKYCGDFIIPARAPDSPEALGLATTVPCD